MDDKNQPCFIVHWFFRIGFNWIDKACYQRAADFTWVRLATCQNRQLVQVILWVSGLC